MAGHKVTFGCCGVGANLGVAYHRHRTSGKKVLCDSNCCHSPSGAMIAQAPPVGSKSEVFQIS